MAILRIQGAYQETPALAKMAVSLEWHVWLPGPDSNQSTLGATGQRIGWSITSAQPCITVSIGTGNLEGELGIDRKKDAIQDAIQLVARGGFEPPNFVFLPFRC